MIPTGEAAIVAGEMGAVVDRVDDMVVGLPGLFDTLDQIREGDMLIPAGTEGALPTVARD